MWTSIYILCGLDWIKCTKIKNHVFCSVFSFGTCCLSLVKTQFYILLGDIKEKNKIINIKAVHFWARGGGFEMWTAGSLLKKTFSSFNSHIIWCFLCSLFIGTLKNIYHNVFNKPWPLQLTSVQPNTSDLSIFALFKLLIMAVSHWNSVKQCETVQYRIGLGKKATRIFMTYLWVNWTLS